MHGYHSISDLFEQDLYTPLYMYQSIQNFLYYNMIISTENLIFPIVVNSKIKLILIAFVGIYPLVT